MLKFSGEVKSSSPTNSLTGTMPATWRRVNNFLSGTGVTFAARRASEKTAVGI
jgi:hypothetical protein